MGMPNPNADGIRVVIISHSGKQWEILKSIMEENELVVVPPLFGQPIDVTLDKQRADVLLVNLDDSEDDKLDALIDNTKLPVLFNDSATIRKPTNISGRAWGRRLCEKLAELALDFNVPDKEQHAAAEERELRVVETAMPVADSEIESQDYGETQSDSDRGFYVPPAMDLEIDLKLLEGFELDLEDEKPDSKPEQIVAEPVSEPLVETTEDQIPEIDTGLELDLDLEMDLELEFGPSAGSKSEQKIESEQQTETEDMGNYLELPTLVDQTESGGAQEAGMSSAAGLEDSSEMELVDLGLTGEIHLEDSQLNKLNSVADGFEDSGIANLAREVWVLGASIGGPQAVKAFLRGLPANFPAGFILAQHIGVGFVSLLAEQLRQVTDLEVLTAEPGKRLLCGQLLVAPVEKRLVFDEYGYIQFAPITQRTIYSPSIDDVITEVTKKYGKNSRAIIFSGMGSDGTIGCREVAAAGGTIWAQEAKSCVISSMADSVRDSGLVSASGQPEELAQYLIKKYLKSSEAES